MPSRDTLPAGLPPGIYPYLGGSVNADQLHAVMARCGGCVVPGKAGAKLAAGVPGVLVDPAQYKGQMEHAQEPLFDGDEWLERQLAAGVPVVVTDAPRIRNRDRSALRKALARWEAIDQSTLVVLPVEPWWLRGGLSCLTEEVKAAGRPVALVLLDHYNGLDLAGSIAGLCTFLAAVEDVPIVLLRCDISAIGAVAYGAFAGFIGWSTDTRHGPLPFGRPGPGGRGDRERDETPAVFVPSLHDYFKASLFPAIARRGRQDVLRCDGPSCGGDCLLQIAGISEVDLGAARALAYSHNVATAEQIARRVLAREEPRDAWWETCKAGADATASLVEDGLSIPVARWLRQWVELGSPAHEPETIA